MIEIVLMGVVMTAVFVHKYWMPSFSGSCSGSYTKDKKPEEVKETRSELEKKAELVDKLTGVEFKLEDLSVGQLEKIFELYKQ